MLAQTPESRRATPKELTALRPDLPGIVVDGADHYVTEERPEKVAQIIREFTRTSEPVIERHQRPGPA